MTYLILAGVAFAAGIFLIVRANALKHEIQRYEFNNTTDGGVVQFKDYEESIAHKRKGGRVILLLIASAIPITAGIFSLLAAAGDAIKP